MEPKRNRFIGFVQERSAYIPTITKSISNFATNAFDSSNEVPKSVPPNSKILLYNTYTRMETHEGNTKYITDVQGNFNCPATPGSMTRRNRLLLSMAKQFVKNPSTFNTDQFEHELESEMANPDTTLDQLSGVPEFSRTSTMSTTASSISQTNSMADLDDTLVQRLEGFLCKSIPDQEVRVTIGSETRSHNQALKSKTVRTFANGDFVTQVATDYVPSIIQVSSTYDDQIFSFQQIMLIPDCGVGVISDIDDTIRQSGVIGDKRSLFTNIFVKPYRLCEVPNISRWFNSLAESCNVSFHYVSNSPWQLYPTTYQFFEEIGLPTGSIHLKKYSGNLLSSFMQPASERKRIALQKILRDLPHRKYILIGDSGEQDMEAYLEICIEFPSQILGVYIRVVDNSLSDFDDDKIFKELQQIMDRDHKNCRTPALNPLDEDLIDLDTEIEQTATEHKPPHLYRKPPMIPPKPKVLKGAPIVPKKPVELKGRSVVPQQMSSSSTTSLSTTNGKGTLTSSNLDPPPLPRRTSSSPSSLVYTKLSSLSSNDREKRLRDAGTTEYINSAGDQVTYTNYDKKGELWKQRIHALKDRLPDHIDFQFWWNVDDKLIDQSIEKIKKSM
ncbi:hypothetical protein LJB42_001083 [Komagataella kurtzmanii]|nr:hypothetical protein LJB42_001083 [Komagataella kurtzmanii]